MKRSEFYPINRITGYKVTLHHLRQLIKSYLAIVCNMQSLSDFNWRKVLRSRSQHSIPRGLHRRRSTHNTIALIISFRVHTFDIRYLVMASENA